MAKQRFEPGVAYPCDAVGAYVEYEGTVTKVHDDHPEDDEVRIDVHVEGEGDFYGYWLMPKRAPKVGYLTTIRVYDMGGGFYPENSIRGWRSTR